MLDGENMKCNPVAILSRASKRLVAGNEIAKEKGHRKGDLGSSHEIAYEFRLKLYPVI
jgi:hypothetical protein